ncbi:hypothetical protein N0V82_003739 [Gnomoniopsis sp. IMI 355080]|nr:hypothetical protein N0V82_003739 [Gnomoniopsis sp. IMI 355080]
MEPRFIANDFSPLFTIDNNEDHLKQALDNIVTTLPPRDQYPVLKGLWAGPTGFAYLFLHVHSRYPDLKVNGLCAIGWAKRYIEGDRSHLPLESRCGIGCETLAFLAVRAAILHDPTDVQRFISIISTIVEDKQYPDEVLQGRSGTLYLLRVIRHWFPRSSLLVEDIVQSVTQAILAHGQDWKWHGKRYWGAVHGDIGIVTQVVLTTPSLAPTLEEKLAQILELQLPSGNWSSSEDTQRSCLVQFCHGAPGFLHSLNVLQQYFPKMQAEIGAAIERGRECIWKEGLLVKEPSICHGIFGNAL